MTTTDLTEKLSTLTVIYDRLVETENLIDAARKQVEMDFAEPDDEHWFNNPISYTVSVSEPIEKAREAFTLFVVRQLNKNYKNLTINENMANGYTKDRGFNAADLVKHIEDVYIDEDDATLRQIKAVASDLIPYHNGRKRTIDELDMLGDTGFVLRVHGYEYESKRKVETFLKLIDITLRGIRPSEVETRTVELGKVYKDDKIKSLRYFKNDSLKVVFKTVDDCEKVKTALFVEVIA